MAPQHQTTGGVAIEPMRQHRWARQAEAQRVKRIFQIRAAFRPAMHRQAGRLVDHKHQAVAMQDAGHNVVGAELWRIHGGEGVFRLWRKVFRAFPL